MVITPPSKVAVSNPKIEPLGLHHDRAAFLCLNQDLTDYMRDGRALKEAVQRDTSVYVCINEEKPTQIIGYFTLAQGQVSRDSIARGMYGNDWRSSSKFRNKIFSKFPRDFINATILGKLAIHSDLKGQDFGEELLGKALAMALKGADIVASKMVYLDAIHEKVVPFYVRAGFQRTEDGSLKMFLLMDTIASGK